MNRDDIIKLAREAGLVRTGDGWTEPHRWGMTEIECFAALVAAALAEPEQEPVGTARELFTNTTLKRLDIRPSTKVYLDAPPQRKPPTASRGKHD